MADVRELLDECAQLPDNIASAAESIVWFISSVAGSDWHCGESGRWRPRSANFITLKPQWKQARSLAVTLRGNPTEFEISEVLPMKADQGGYSVFRLERAEQIADAFAYIKRARIIYDRGRSRSQTTPTTIG